MPFTVIAHGGALSPGEQRDGPQAACDVALANLADGASILDAAVAGVVAMEDDGRFNAGSGATPRIDGRTVELDAACMTSDGTYGGVVGIRVRNPILVARRVHGTPHIALCGRGAMEFARRLGLAQPHRTSPEAKQRARELRQAFLDDSKSTDTGWDLERLRNAWNYPGRPPESDTVGVIVSDGTQHAVAASTGGLSISLRGRMSDVAMLGAGIFAGPAGAVAVTGHGEYLTQHLVAHHAYLRMRDGKPSSKGLAEILAAAHPGSAVGMIAVGAGGPASASNRDMPWAAKRS